MVGAIKNFLSAYQKKTDFKPDDMAIPGQTEACQKVVSYVMECRRVLDQSLDGKNLEVVLLEFGIRIQRVIYDHVQQFVISENGLLHVLCMPTYILCHYYTIHFYFLCFITKAHSHPYMYIHVQ